MSFSVLSSGLAVPGHYQPQARPKAVDLFCGAGGFSLGIIQAGFEVVAACDYDPSCTHTYLHNLGTYPCNIVYLTENDGIRLDRHLKEWAVQKHGELETMQVSGSNRPAAIPGVPNFFFGDVRKLTGEMILTAAGLEVGELDLVVGGPPCQGFSMAGKRNVMDPRNSLVFEFTRLVLEMKPKFMVMENVVGIMSMVTAEGIPVIDAMARTLCDGGFGAYDALRRSLGAMPGAKVAARKEVERGRGRGPVEERPLVEATQQGSFL
jgi:DNA (cytosine-5)-methyltransferase 1